MGIIYLLVIVAAGLALAMWLFVLSLEWTQVFRPVRDLTTQPSDVGLAFEDVEFMTEDSKRLHGWWIPCEGADATILFCHGNSGNIGTRVDTLRVLQEFGVHVFAFDYRGYGRSRGIPTERGTRKDALAAYEVVRSRYRDVEDPPIILYGRSLGGAVAMQLASERPVLGVAVESTFSSLLDLAAHLYPFVPYRLLGRYRFDTARAAASVSAPKLIAHSTDDELIPVEMGREIHEAAADPKQYHELRGGHSEPGWISNPAYHDVLATFIRTVAQGTPMGPQQ